MIETPTLGMDGKRSRGAVPAAALAVDMSIVQMHAKWWNPALEPQVEAPQFSVVEGVDGAISAWVAAERNRVSGPGLLPEGEERYADLAHQGKLRELEA